MRLPAVPVESFEEVTLDLEVLQGDPSWQTPALLNSWANFGSGYETAGYRKDGVGFVHLKGAITGGTPPSVAFVLRPGYRPGAKTHYVGGDGIKIQIYTDGTVNLIGWVSAAGNPGLSGISFYAEN